MRLSNLTRVLVVVFLLVPLVAPAQQRRRNAKPGAKSVSDLKGRLNSVRNKRERVEEQIRKNKQQTHRTIQEIAYVDGQLDIVEHALQKTEVQLADSRVKQKKVTGELEVASDKLKVVKEEVKARLARIYATGPTSSLSVLLGSHSGGELASRSEVMSQIAKSDRKVFENYRALRNEVASRKLAADALVVEVAGLERQQKEQQDQLEDKKATKKEKIKQLERNRAELEEALRQIDRDEAQLTAQIEAFMRNLNRSGAKLAPLVGGFLRPVPGRVTSSFGMRYHPILKKWRLHAGCDFHAPTGTPVKAAADGVVAASQRMRGYGNVVMVAHGSGYSTVYAHLSRIYVTAGQRVSKGQLVGASGATGLATAPHLHFEVKLNGRAINPQKRM